MSKENNKTRSLAKGSVIYGIGNIGTLVINFFLVPLYTFYLSKEDLGFFDLMASALVLMTPVFFGHIELAVIRWVLSKKDSVDIKSVVSNSFLVFLLGLLLFSVVFVIVNLFFSIDLAPYVYLYLISNFFYIISKQVIRGVYSSAHYVATELAYVLIVLLVTIFFIDSYGLKSIFFAYGVASIVLLVYLLILNITKYISFSLIRLRVIKELLNYSFPLVLNAGSLWLNNQSSKYIIVSFLTLSANGIYAIAFKIAYVIQILNRIFYYSFQDKIFAIYGTKGFDNYFSKTFNSYTSILFGLLYLLIGVQNIALPFIIGPDFQEARLYIPILGLGVVFMSLASILGIVYQCEKKNMHAFKTSLVSGVVVVVLGFLIIPYYGLYGAAAVFAFGNFVWLGYRYYDVQKFVKVSASMNRFILYIFAVIAVWAITLLGSMLSYVLSFCLAIVVAWVLNNAFLSKYYLELKSKMKF